MSEADVLPAPDLEPTAEPPDKWHRERAEATAVGYRSACPVDSPGHQRGGRAARRAVLYA